jgi:hypothetical protein
VVEVQDFASPSSLLPPFENSARTRKIQHLCLAFTCLLGLIGEVRLRPEATRNWLRTTLGRAARAAHPAHLELRVLSLSRSRCGARLCSLQNRNASGGGVRAVWDGASRRSKGASRLVHGVDGDRARVDVRDVRQITARVNAASSPVGNGLALICVSEPVAASIANAKTSDLEPTEPA